MKHRTGKIARLPREIRQTLNLRLREGDGERMKDERAGGAAAAAAADAAEPGSASAGGVGAAGDTTHRSHGSYRTYMASQLAHVNDPAKSRQS